MSNTATFETTTDQVTRQCEECLERAACIDAFVSCDRCERTTVTTTTATLTLNGVNQGGVDFASETEARSWADTILTAMAAA